MNQVHTMPRRRKDAAEPSEPAVSITVRFPADLRKRAIAVAEAEDRTFASLVIYALRRYVTEQEREIRTDSGK
jgi:hypothetical protein